MIYIGNFLQITNQQSPADKRHGKFSMIVEADNYDKAVELFKEKITFYKETSDLFGGKCTIYFIQLLEFVKIPKNEALLMNYNSYAGDPVMPFIGCSIPDSESDSCRIYNWKDNHLEVNGYSGQLLMSFELN